MQLLNEAERFLVDRWAEARLLEEAMETVRTKYKELIQRVIEAVTEIHPELDAHAAYPTQFFDSGTIGFGQKSWPTDRYGTPSGFWIGGLRLELLTAEDSEPPYAAIWVPNRAILDHDAARAAINMAANKLLSSQELNGVEIPDSGNQLIWLPAPSKKELRAALCEGDGQRFVEALTSQFDMMARFVPTLDEMFREYLKTEPASSQL